MTGIMQKFQPSLHIVGGTFSICRKPLYQRIARIVEQVMQDDGYNINVRVGGRAPVVHLPDSAVDNVRYYHPRHHHINERTGNRVLIDHQRGVIWFGVERPKGEWDKAEMKERMRIASELFARLLREQRVQFRQEIIERAHADYAALIKKVSGEMG